MAWNGTDCTCNPLSEGMGRGFPCGVANVSNMLRLPGAGKLVGCPARISSPLVSATWLRVVTPANDSAFPKKGVAPSPDRVGALPLSQSTGLWRS